MLVKPSPNVAFVVSSVYDDGVARNHSNYRES